MRKILILFALALVCLATPQLARAQDTSSQDDFLLRISGPVTIPVSETVDTAVVISGDAQIDGAIRNGLVVINGNAVVTGQIAGDLTVIDGTVTLQQGATVENISLINSQLNRSEGVMVSGTIHNDTWSWAASQATVQAFSILFWLGMTLAVLLAAFAFAWLARRQLEDSVSLLRQQPGRTALWGLALWVGLPLLATLAIVTILGLPSGLAVLFVVLPILWLLGYLVFGFWVGASALRLVKRNDQMARPILAAVVGILILQVIALIPVLGGLIVLLGGIWGSGALVYRAIGLRPRKEKTVPITGPATAHA